MELWAKQYANAQFLCICVESLDVALAFHRMFAFDGVINGYIPSRSYFPKGYGQLGCSGFIVSDADGCFVSRKTKAFLEYREGAFREVEDMLLKLMPAAPVKGLSMEREIFNGKVQDLEVPPSVGIPVIDKEHEECTHAFNDAMKHQSLSSLVKLIEVLTGHFAHEEQLMRQYWKNGKNSSFSAVDSHALDHKRMLDMANEELKRVQLKAVSCSTDQ